MKIANKIVFQQIEEIIANGSEVELRVKGYSMRPLLRSDRDVVLLRPLRERDIQVGAIVLFRYNGQHILHRVVTIDGKRLTMSGDGNYKTYEYCTAQDIVAVVDSVIRKSGRRVECNSTYWRFASKLWIITPTIIRRYTLAILWRLGYK